MLGSEYGWKNTKKKSKQSIKIFGEDDFKFFIFICIFIFCLAGLVLLITGIFIQLDLEGFIYFAGEDYMAVTTFITVVGAFILAVSCLGIYGVFNDINTIIYTYTFFLFLMITAELAATTSALKLNTDIGEKVEIKMKVGLENFGKHDQEGTKAWDTVQGMLKCCGMNNYTDWLEEQLEIPSSCYDQVNVNKEYCWSKPMHISD
jgi:hypothetical protein